MTSAANIPQPAADSDRKHADRLGTDVPDPTIVLVDDNPHDRALVIRALRREFPEVQVIEVTNAAELARALMVSDFDLVITDYVLGWIDGLRVLRGVKARTPHIPVIMFTGTGNEEIAVEAMKAGLDDYVVKRADHYARVAATVSNTLARVRAERARDELAERLRDMLERLSVGVFRASPDGRLLEVNPAAERMLGIGRDRATAPGCLQDYCPARHRRELSHLLHDLEEVRGYEIRLERTGVTVALRTVHEVQADGTSVVLGLLEDVSERRRRRELERRLSHSERLASLGRLAAGVAHEVNNPATFVLLNQQGARRRLDDIVARLGARQRTELATGIERIRTMLDESVDGVERISAIVRELKLFAGSSERETAPVALGDVVAWACRIVDHELRGRASLRCDVDEAPTIVGDRGRLSQVIINLLSNAAQAIPAGNPDGHYVRVSARAVGADAVVTVEDTGCGIPPELQEEIFEPFFTTKPRDVGTGLGLPIAAEIIREHDGTLRIDSRTGAGTRVEVRLPIERHGLPSRPRVLVVDPDPLRLRSCAARLQGVCDAETALGSDAALDVLRADTAFDAVVCDLATACTRLYASATEIAPNLARRFILVSETGSAPCVRHSIGDDLLVILRSPIVGSVVVEHIRDWQRERPG